MLKGKFREYIEEYQLCADVFGYIIDNNQFKTVLYIS